MSGLSVAELMVTAKAHLGLPPSPDSDCRVPKFYLDNLRYHLMNFPNEDKFRVTLQPNTGFGSVICLKDNCHAVIALTRRVNAKVRDGGKRDGFGSLAAYREHLSTHVKLEIPVRIGSDHHSLHAQPTALPKSRHSLPTSSFQSPLHLSSQGPATAPYRVKPEPVEPMIPRKRMLDVDVKVERSDGDPSLPSPPKKPKPELTPDSSGFLDTRHNIGDMGTLEEVQTAIRDQETILRSFYAHIDTGTDFHQINYVNNEINRLRTLEMSYLHGMRNSAHHTLNEGHVAQSSWAGYQEERKPRMIPREFPMQLDAEEIKPYTLDMGFAQDSVDRQPGLVPPTFSIVDDTERKPSVQSITAQQHAPVASSSSSDPWVSCTTSNTSASSSKPLYPSLDDMKPPSLEYLESKIPGDFDTDSEGSSDSDEEHELPIDLAPFVNNLGVHAPPPILGNSYDAHDYNGDFHAADAICLLGLKLLVMSNIEKFLIEAGNAETFDGNESVEKALKYLGLRNLHDKVPGMDISLMAHQAMGVAWMLEKEKSGLLGGCLADEMGLGKTVQMITCVVKNRSVDPACKTTLVVAPLALLDQWKLEIEDKSNCGFSCLIYHGQSRTKKKSEILKHDIVLTTFNTMAMEWPDYENEMKKKAKARKQKDSFIVSDSDDADMQNVQYRTNKRKQHSGLLFQVEFYRIVVDEGQQIRNKRTRMSRAITELRTRYRWVLTGTPIVNGLADVYGYIRFLRIRPWYDWLEFHTHIGKLEKKRPAIAVARLQKIMTTFLLRRKKDSKLDGKNLIELPEKKIELSKLEFSQEERDIYSMVEIRSQAKFNRYLREGTVLKNYHNVLVLLLRLRQLCSHPCLIQEDGVAFVHPDEAKVKPQLATELSRARRLVSSEFVDKMKEKFKQDALNRMQTEKQSANAAIEEEECPICYDAMTDAVITPCSHIFCRDCIVDVLNRAPPMDASEHTAATNVKERPCPVCRAAITAEKCFSRGAFEPSDKDLSGDASDDDDSVVEVEDYLNDSKGKGKAVPKPKKSGRISRKMIANSDYESDDDDDDDMSDFIVESDEDEDEKDARLVMKARSGKKNAHIVLDSEDEPDTPEEQEVIFGVRKKVPDVSKDGVPTMSRFLPSTKMKYMMNLLQKLAKTNPEEKTLVVSQWTGCLTLVSDYLTENGIPHVKYQGDMNRAKREQAVQVFMSKEKARVMLMSLKCGGVGLNLTRANNVISLDLGWSQAVESQAYDRVHRLGQTRKVTVQRLVIADTVEDRILALQARKQALADGSLGEGSGQKIGKLTVKELANLFGLDGRGRRLA